MNRFITRAAGFLLALCFAVFVLAELLEVCGTSDTLMAQMMRTYAPEADTGLADSEYDGMALMITRYLAGASDEFQYSVDDGYGRQTALFHDYEQEHMADCKGLFDLDRTVLLITGAALALLTLLLMFQKDRVNAARGCLWGGGFCLVLVTALAVWALVDFNGLFVTFHHLSFSNSLWLLDPDTDLLIRLMPLKFFICYVTVIGVMWLVALTLFIVISALCARKPKRSRTYHAL